MKRVAAIGVGWTFLGFEGGARVGDMVVTIVFFCGGVMYGGAVKDWEGREDEVMEYTAAMRLCYLGKWLGRTGMNFVVPYTFGQWLFCMHQKERWMLEVEGGLGLCQTRQTDVGYVLARGLKKLLWRPKGLPYILVYVSRDRQWLSRHTCVNDARDQTKPHGNASSCT